MKNAFYFMLKGLFILKTFKVLSWVLGHEGKGLIRKLRLISKFMASQTSKQTITIHILPNISQEVKAIRQWGLVS